MPKRVYITFASIFILLVGCKTQSDGKLTSLKFPENKQLSEDFIHRLHNLKEGYYRIYKNDSEKIKNQSKNYILKNLKENNDYEFVVKTEYWLAFNYKEGIPELIKLITNDKEIGLENYYDIIILERVKVGDMTIDHGNFVEDDLFKISGRANYLLKEITGEDFGNARMTTSKKQLMKIQNQWIEWLRKK